MCTILVLHRVHPTYPVVIAGNRDEFYARETAPPRVLAPDLAIVGGLDLRGGGTWLGLSPDGAFAAITNQRSWFEPRPAARSRGRVVIDTLAAASRAGPGDGRRAMREHLEALDPRAQNSFNLLAADPFGVEVAYARREEGTIEIESLPAGIYVLANDRLESPSFPKLARARELIEPHAAAPWHELEASLAGVLADHALPPLESIERPPPGARLSRDVARALQAICIHTPGYGTRSATMAALHPHEGVSHYLYADGPPCEARFADQTRLLQR